MSTSQPHPLVQAALDAMRTSDRAAWFRLFAEHVTLTDDGSPQDFVQWADNEFFGANKAYLATVERVENGGLTVYGKFHSDRWGDFDTFMKFQIQGDKITRLDVGQK